MTTEVQKRANRRNAKKSTGPRTTEGKNRASQNARTHAFKASAFTVLRLEDNEEVERLRADLIAVYQPVNAQELYVIERIAVAQHTLLRSARLETGLFIACLGEALDPLEADRLIAINEELSHNVEVASPQKRNHALAHGFHRMVQQANSWSLCLRYQALAERNYRRAIEDLERLRALRGELPNEPNFDPQPQPDTATSTHFPANPVTTEIGDRTD